jgi:adenylate cyclase
VPNDRSQPPEEQAEPPEEQAEPPEEQAEPPEEGIDEAVRKADRKESLLRAARLMRQILPGDSELGDPLSTAGDKPSAQIARRVAETRPDEPSVARELGLGALQVWQALSEAQGRGRGDVELAILFTDLVEFSSWALEVGDEAVVTLLREVGRAQESTIAERRGRVVKRLGDGLMAVFDDPQAAVEAAVEACRRVLEVEVDGYRPELRAGVHVGKPRRLGGDYLGVDVNVAARVAEAASGGQVLVSGAASERLEPTGFELKRVRRFKAKGAPKELEVYSVEPA